MRIENKEFHLEQKFLNKEAQLAMTIVWRYLESKASIAHETFKPMPHLEIGIEFERKKTFSKLHQVIPLNGSRYFKISN